MMLMMLMMLMTMITVWQQKCFMELALPWIRAGDCHRQWRIRRSQCAPLVEAGEAQFLVTGEATNSEILYIYIYIIYHIISY